MPTVSFDSYKIWYYSGYDFRALIYCYQGSDYVGRMVFYDDDAAIPDNREFSGGPSLHYGLSRFNDIVSILREEKPLRLFLSPTNLVGSLATSDFEPVGEEET